MDLRLLGRTGIRVSALSLGTYTFGPNPDGIGSTTAEDARELVAVAIDAGVNLFDTADVYADGLSEEILGTALGGRRDEVLVATKCHFRPGAGEGGRFRLRLARTRLALRATTSSAPAKPACGDSVRTGSIFSSSTQSTSSLMSSRRCVRSTTSSEPAR